MEFNDNETTKVPKHPIQTVEKALDVFDILISNKYRDGISISELSNELSLGKSTVHRIIESMVSKKYIDQDIETKKYLLSWKLFEVGNVIPRKRNLFSLDNRILQNLCDKFQETVNMGVRVDDCVVTINKISPTTTLISNIQIGSRESLHATAMGKVLISEMTREEIIKIFGDQPLESYTSNTITSIEALLEDLKKIRKRGFSIDDEEYCAGLTCISMPLRDYKNEIVSAISISGSSIRMTENKIQEICTELKAATDKLSTYLGYHENTGL